MSKFSAAVIYGPAGLTALYAKFVGGATILGSIGIGVGTGVITGVGMLGGAAAGALTCGIADEVENGALLGGIIGGVGGLLLGYYSMSSIFNDNAEQAHINNDQAIEHIVSAEQLPTASFEQNKNGQYVLPASNTPQINV